MDSVVRAAAGVRLQDAVLCVLCALLIYILRAKPSAILQPIWHADLHLGRQDETLRGVQLPAPIVTDLDGDGISEVVIVTRRGELQTLRVPIASEESTQRLPELQVVNSTQLPLEMEEDGERSIPVVMETGYFTRYQSMVQVRKQVIVVVLDTWHVFCYSHALELLWQQRLLNVGQARETHRVHAMAALVTSHVLSAGDEGCVIVGGSFIHRAHRHGSPRPGGASSGGGGAPMAQARGAVSRRREEEEQLADTWSHFSTFALSGNNGSVRWHHLPTDFQPKQPVEAPLEPHHWKLALKRNVLHVGEQPWSKFSTSIVKQLPHWWAELWDTRMELLQLRKPEVSSPSSGSEAPAPLPTIVSDLFGEHLQGYAYGGLRPHSPVEHVQHPDTVLVHGPRGLEALALRTGQPLTTLPLLGEATLHADLTGTGNIASVKLEDCSIEVEFGTQRAVEAYRVSLCEDLSWWASVVSRPHRDGEGRLAAAPVAVPSVADGRSVVAHALGASLPSRRKGFDHVYLTSGHRLVSLDAAGNINWDTYVPLTPTPSGAAAGDAAAALRYSVFIKPFSPVVYGKITALIVAGYQDVVVVELTSGRVLAAHSAPCRVTRPPVLRDMTGDGATDVIVVCDAGYVGFALHRDANVTRTALLGASVVLALLWLTWVCKPADPEPPHG